MSDSNKIVIKGATENNLKSVDVEIPRNALVVVTGVSGSGKSSLVFDTLCKEGRWRYLRSLSSHTRQFLGKLGRAKVESIDGISPAISLEQKTTTHNPRSTVGTMSELYDLLRLLFARQGDGPGGTNSSLFSFNSPSGACPECKGLGVVDRIDPALLVDDHDKTIRQGALKITTPTGYLVYSQVTLDVLNQVCEAHGFDVDIPWKDLTGDQLDIVLNGSSRIKIPYGKHPLENRLKWQGITAKPREEGHYKGIVPVMSEILKRDRNKNILRFARTADCPDCGGSRLCPDALAIKYRGLNIAEMAQKSIDSLEDLFRRIESESKLGPLGEPIAKQLLSRTGLLKKLGLGYLRLSRNSSSLSAGEIGRTRLATQVGAELQGTLVILDEPGMGLHARDIALLIQVLRKLRDNGNTVVVVAHDETIMRCADWIVDTGPLAGEGGGEIVFSGTPKMFEEQAVTKSKTGSFLFGNDIIEVPSHRRKGTGEICIKGAKAHNLKNLDATIKTGAFNVVTGVSGSGKSTFVNHTLARAVRVKLGQQTVPPGEYEAISGLDRVDKLVEIDQSPIGRTPRSNPATYTKLFDVIRQIFASSQLSLSRNYGKGRFSFNVKGGRCETCGGAGVTQVGMHFLDDVSIVCDTCSGRRFNSETLEVTVDGKNIFDVLEMSVTKAAQFFKNDKKAKRILDALVDVGLGYMPIGQPSTFLSGGEAQRVRLAQELGRVATGKTLYILSEPTCGLHNSDIKILLVALNRLVEDGNTAVIIEHHMDVIKVADWIIDFGSSSGVAAGKVSYTGTPEQVTLHKNTSLNPFLSDALMGLGAKVPGEDTSPPVDINHMTLGDVNTHNLKGFDVSIPHDKMTVVTGVSGSGKSSLAFDTIYAMGNRSFSESLSTHARRHFKQLPTPPVGFANGVRAAVSLSQQRAARNPRSTVATFTDIYDQLRLLFSRTGTSETGEKLSAKAFSFNQQDGACPTCLGLGLITKTDPKKLVTNPILSLFDGAMDGTKSGRFYGEQGGRYLAILQAVGISTGTDFDVPFIDLSPEDQDIAMFGLGNQQFNVVWEYNRKGREGEHVFDAPWLGMAGYVDEEYQRVHGDHRGETIADAVMTDTMCTGCGGHRLNERALSVKFAGRSLGELTVKSISQTADLLKNIEINASSFGIEKCQLDISKDLRASILERLDLLTRLGLGYLPLNRKAASLSGGELSRVKLATQLSSNICGVTYVLDEPTVGLHPKDTSQLLEVLNSLQTLGNTLVVVEHDLDVIKSAHHIIELGPGAGQLGGEIIASGNEKQIRASEQSKTGKYLNRDVKEQSPSHNLTQGSISILGANANNLKHIDVDIPKGGIIAVTGVSGSGKTSLIFDVLKKSAQINVPWQCEVISGLDSFERIVDVDRSPVGKSPSSTVATYSGVFDRIREIFARTDDAIRGGYKKANFSYTTKGGRCEACQGNGQKRIEMGFLEDVWIPCDDCGGGRYKKELLDIKFRDKSIKDVLDMTAAQACSLFENDKKVESILSELMEVGLDYVPLGQSLPTLSGGEAGRLKLARELTKKRAGKKKSTEHKNLYLLDEPTTGLHPEDVENVLSLFRSLADAGNTVIVVEHNLDVIGHADWVIDLGPEGGQGGGEIVAQGTPGSIAMCSHSWTGRALCDYWKC